MAGFRASIVAVILAAFVATAGAQSPESDGYMLGEQRRLEIVVHVLGEVKRPGELRVPDNTNVLEALSKAGGGTEFANLNTVTVTRTNSNVAGVGHAGREQILHVNIEDYLHRGTAEPLPVLEPGDVVSVSRNGYSRWKTTASVIRDLSIIASTYFLYVRTTK